MAIAGRDFRELRLDDMSRNFGTVNALKGVTLNVRRGEFIALLGPSGCGKSTALNCLAGLLTLSGGSVWLDQTRIDQLKPEERGFGMVFQNYALFPHMSVRKNIGFGLAMQGRPKAEIERKVDEALAIVRLSEQGHKLPGQLSGGQQQRVAIARAIVIEPPLVLMDEPLSNLDAKLRLEMRAEIRRIHDLIGSATIYVTHDQEEALSLADRIVVMRAGEVRQVGTPEDLYARPAHADVAEFMGYRNQLRVTAARAGAGVTIRVGNITMTGTAVEPFAEGQAVAAIRAEDLAVAADGPLEVKTDTSQYHGDYFYSSGRTADGAELYFRSERRLAKGDTVRLAADPARVLVYAGSQAVTDAALVKPAERPPLRVRLKLRDIDGVTLLVLPAALFVLALFVYPFAYGFVLSFMPKKGDWLANYAKFFSDPFLYDTIWSTFRLAIPATLVNVLISVPIALRVRRMRHRRVLTTLLVVPITLGTVLIAQGLLIYLGPQGWFNRALAIVGIGQMRLVHNYTGVMLSLIMSGFPFTFLLTLSYLTGIDPSLEQAAATLGAKARARFVHILLPLLAQGLAINLCLSFVQTFSVFPSAVLLGAPAGETRVISIAAYQAAYEQYDYSMASAVAMIMGFCQLGVVILILAGRNLLYRGAVAGGKG